ncbi:unnamed protein product [Echinostoma caproni]|uniref:Carbon-nitrogen hydrolase n=1 Tax=Echinostoma caproni TaxID=27848 RepID=A0A183A989_9TREM|nr:unnamed protein product [Echinostoma caproni]
MQSIQAELTGFQLFSSCVFHRAGQLFAYVFSSPAEYDLFGACFVEIDDLISEEIIMGTIDFNELKRVRESIPIGRQRRVDVYSLPKLVNRSNHNWPGSP